jgi:lysozyme family protein
MTSFTKAVGLILEREGGYVNDPKDPGGETNFGISKRQYPAVDIKALTREAAIAIYKRDYWLPCKCDDLPWPLSLFIFDAAVNQGVLPAKKMLQKAIDVAQDGIFGPVTMNRAKRATLVQVARFMALRTMRYQGTRNYDKFGEGWLVRMYLVAMESTK